MMAPKKPAAKKATAKKGTAKKATAKKPAPRKKASALRTPAKQVLDWKSDPSVFGPLLQRLHGAWGLKMIKPGFSFSPDQDALFALGWPHICTLVDGHPHDDDPAGNARRLIDSLGPTYLEPAYRGIWPREVAYRFVRAASVLQFRMTPSSVTITPEVLKQMAVAGAPGKNEVRKAFDFTFTGANNHAWWIAEDLVLVAEAILGAEAAADVLMSALEALREEHWRRSWGNDAKIAEAAYALGFMALRMNATQRKATLTRARKILSTAKAAEPTGYGASMLDCVLGGAEAARRSGNLTLSRFHHVLDDGSAIVEVERRKGGDFYPNARLVFLAGPEMLDLYRARWRQLKTADKQLAFLWQMHWLRSKQVVAIVKELATASKVRREASAWLAANA